MSRTCPACGYDRNRDDAAYCNMCQAAFPKVQTGGSKPVLDNPAAAAASREAIACGQQGRHQEALALFDRALALEPLYPGTWVNKATTLSSLGREAEALVCFDAAIKLDPRLAAAWNGRADSLARIGRHEEALAASRQAVDLAPEQTIFWNNRGALFNAAGDPKGAVEAFSRALQLDPKNLVAWHNKGMTEAGMGRTIDAIESLKRFIALAPVRLQEQLESARRRIRELESGGQSVDTAATLRKAGIQENQKLWDRALETYREVVDSDATSGVGWAGVGRCALALRRFDEASAAVDRAIELVPGDVDLWRIRGTLRLTAADLQGALDAFERAIAIEPTALVFTEIGGVLAKMARWEESIEAFDHAIAIDSKYALARYGRAQSLEGLQRWDEARTTYQQFLSFAPPQFATQIRHARERLVLMPRTD